MVGNAHRAVPIRLLDDSLPGFGTHVPRPTSTTVLGVLRPFVLAPRILHAPHKGN